MHLFGGERVVSKRLKPQAGDIVFLDYWSVVFTYNDATVITSTVALSG